MAAPANPLEAPANPDDPFAALPAGPADQGGVFTDTISAAGPPPASPFDFGPAPTPTVAGSSFGGPAGASAIPTAIPTATASGVGGPASMQSVPTAKPAADETPVTPPPASGGVPKSMISAIAMGLLFVVLSLSVSSVLISRAFAGSNLAADAAESGSTEGAPKGFQWFRENGVEVLLPVGYEAKVYPASWDAKAVQVESGVIFFIGVMDQVKELDKQGRKRKLVRMTGGDYRESGVAKRNGYEGFRCILDQNIFLGRVNAECYHVGGRLIVLGVSSEQAGGGNVVVGQKTEGEREKVFFESFKVGPKPKGWFF